MKPLQQYNLTEAEVPTGSKLLVIGDVHIPIDNRPAIEVAINLAEDVGVTHVVSLGDLADCHCISDHAKDVDRLLSAGTLREEMASGKYLINWMSTRPVISIPGNHEYRVDRLIGANPGLYGMSTPEILGLPKDWVHLQDNSQVRLGSLVFAHGHYEFRQGNGGRHPAAALLTMAPDQSTIVGHLHRLDSARRTSVDEHGIRRTRAAWTNPHLSLEHEHHSYVSRHISWQTGFSLVHVWWEDGRPRWDLTQIEIMLDSRGLPYCAYGGKVYR